jgi:uncharacterized protein (TIRG00374 family)
MNKVIRSAFGIVFAGLFLWLLFRHVSAKEIFIAFENANFLYIGFAVVVFFAGYSCRTARWRLMLTKDNPTLSWRNCFGPLMASVAANNVLPFRAGDVLRAFAYNRKLNISAAASLTSLLIERLLDLLMVISFLGLALAYFDKNSSTFIGVGGRVLLLFSLLILLLLFFPIMLKPVAFSINSAIAKFLPGLGKKLHEELLKFFLALEHVSKSQIMAKLILWSILSWLAEGFVFWLAALALPSLNNHIAAWLALPIGTLATTIPSTPGYIGTFDYPVTKCMTDLGNPTTGAAAYAFLIHAILWLPPSVTGGLYLLINPLGQADTSRAISQ